MPSTVEHSVTVREPIRRVYDQWTQFEDFPAFMNSVERIDQLADDRLHWWVSVGGVDREFDALITEQVPDERIRWQSVSGPEHSGEVTFRQTDDNSTEVHLRMQWEPEGMVEHAGALFMVDDASVKRSLDTFCELMESGRFEGGAWRGEIHNEPAAPKTGGAGSGAVDAGTTTPAEEVTGLGGRPVTGDDERGTMGEAT